MTDIRRRRGGAKVMFFFCLFSFFSHPKRDEYALMELEISQKNKGGFKCHFVKGGCFCVVMGRCHVGSSCARTHARWLPPCLCVCVCASVFGG